MPSQFLSCAKRVLIAGAVDKGGGAAIATKLFEAIAQLFTSPVETDREVVDRDSKHSGDFYERLATEINALQ